jgi:hypothetical protein
MGGEEGTPLNISLLYFVIQQKGLMHLPHNLMSRGIVFNESGKKNA